MEMAESLNIPLMPWSGTTPLESYEDVEKWANKIGFPVILKDSEGGGGKGIRVVRDPKNLKNFYNSILMEGRGKIFVMKLAENCNHLEIQIVGDGENVVHLFGRDCSMQRRNQKLIEEGPITVAPPHLIKVMEDSAVRIAKAVNYKGVGTVEFLYQRSDHSITFLEVNPRLQVEHPVSEMITGTNIPSLQFLIAIGKKIKDIPSLQNISYDGHVIATRINSENPYDNFKPSTGVIDSISFDNDYSTWGYFSIEDGGEIVGTIDAQFGHVFAKGKTRDIARKRLMLALEKLVIKTDISNTAKFLKELLNSSNFREYQYHTQWLTTKNTVSKIADQNLYDENIVIICGLLIKTYYQYKIEYDKYLNLKNNGHNTEEPNNYIKNEIVFKGIIYVASVIIDLEKNLFFININDDKKNIYKVRYKITKELFYLIFDKNIIYTIEKQPLNDFSLNLHINHCLHVFPVKSDPTKLLSSTCGKVLKLYKKNNDKVEAGEAYIEVEVMKMSMVLRTEIPGTLVYHKNVGDILCPNELLAEIKDTDCEIKYEYRDLVKLSDRFSVNYKDIHDQYLEKKIRKSTSNTQLSLSKKHQLCEKVGTTYIYDMINYFNCLSKEQIILDEDNQIKLIDPSIELDKGMVGWLLHYENHKVVLIANNITYKVGSFSYDADNYFYHLSKFARVNNYARVYISCNSGAQLDICNVLKDEYNIKWVNDDIKQGLDYLYLDNEQYKKYSDIVKCTNVNGNWRIDSIANKGITNLDGSALIASETATAYDDTFTLTYVTGRSVGIGAYLCKLGERVIQKKDSSIILTGFNALNTVLQKKCYTSNLELGGPSIMATNGITHYVVDSDKDGVKAIEQWLSYINIPKRRLLDTNLDLTFNLTENYNIRDFISVLLDKDSFFETLSEWGKSVISGRGKLGGIPVGIISANNKMSDRFVPFDPADENSSNQIIKQSGCIWYTDSSYKTAQTISDAKRENIPLLILANWRGFSGGTNDMYNEILKFGSMIVTHLKDYKMPVIVYIPPYAQLRGGAMVVISKSINQDNINLFIDSTANANILEPNALQAIKYKDKDLIKRFGSDEFNKNKNRYIDVALEYCRLHDKPIDNKLFEKIEWKNTRKRFYNLLVEKLGIKN